MRMRKDKGKMVYVEFYRCHRRDTMLTSTQTNQAQGQKKNFQGPEGGRDRA